VLWSETVKHSVHHDGLGLRIAGTIGGIVAPRDFELCDVGSVDLLESGIANILGASAIGRPRNFGIRFLAGGVEWQEEREDCCTKRRADPLVRGRTPGRPFRDCTGLILLGEERVQGDPRGPGGPPHFFGRPHAW